MRVAARRFESGTTSQAGASRAAARGAALPPIEYYTTLYYIRLDYTYYTMLYQISVISLYHSISYYPLALSDRSRQIHAGGPRDWEC